MLWVLHIKYIYKLFNNLQKNYNYKHVKCTSIFLGNNDFIAMNIHVNGTGLGLISRDCQRVNVYGPSTTASWQFVKISQHDF